MSAVETARAALLGFSVAHLRELARAEAIPGRSRMRKAELAEALIPAVVAEVVATEVRRVAAARAAKLALARQTERHTPLTPTPVGAAMDAKDRYLRIVAECGQENGGPEVSAAWGDYLAACEAAETCTRTDCWDRATGGGRCDRHSLPEVKSEWREVRPGVEIRKVSRAR